MGVAELKAAFNEAAEPEFTCSRALLGYETKSGVQYQRLVFHGIGPDSAAFEIRSDLLRPDSDVILAARELGMKAKADVKP